MPVRRSGVVREFDGAQLPSESSVVPLGITPGLEPVHRQVGRHAGLARRENLPSNPLDRRRPSTPVPRGIPSRSSRRRSVRPGGPIHDPGGDVDVDAEPVTADPLRSSGVDTGAHAGRIALAPRRFSLPHGRRSWRRSAPGSGKTTIMPSPMRLTMWPPACSRRLGDLSDPAQQPQRRLVPGLQRPVREADQVGEHERHLGVGGTARHPFGEGLPELQSGQTHLPSHQPQSQCRRPDPSGPPRLPGDPEFGDPLSAAGDGGPNRCPRRRPAAASAMRRPAR